MPASAIPAALPLPEEVAGVGERLDLLEKLTSIGAPTFEEASRSEFVFHWLKAEGLAGVNRDELGNVWVDLSGGNESVCLLDAHLDTVFPEKSITIRREGARWYAPGIFDNTAACAQLMLWTREAAHRGRPRPFLVSFTVGEEGGGDLQGIRAVTERFRSRLRAALVFDLDLDGYSRRAVGSLRYRLQWTGPGGHSWNDYGAPSAIHRAADWIMRLRTAFPWRRGLHSFNIGTFEGGSGVNVIAGQAAATLDIRSVDASFLEAFSTWLEAAAPGAASPSSVIPIGRRPAGLLPPDHSLVTLLRGVHDNLGIRGAETTLSTNGNALLAAGVPTLVTGLARGANIHRADEYLDLSSLGPGQAKLAALADRWENFHENQHH